MKSWWVHCYPPAWRARYGAELEVDLRATQGTARTMLDLLVGVVDAWCHPTLPSPAAAAGSSGRRHGRRTILTAIGLSAALVAAVATVGIHYLLGPGTPATAVAAMVQPMPGPFHRPTPARHGGYYVSCFGQALTPACQQTLSVQTSVPNATSSAAMVQMTFLCQAPICSYRDFEPVTASPTTTPLP